MIKHGKVQRVCEVSTQYQNKIKWPSASKRYTYTYFSANKCRQLLDLTETLWWCPPSPLYAHIWRWEKFLKRIIDNERKILSNDCRRRRSKVSIFGKDDLCSFFFKRDKNGAIPLEKRKLSEQSLRQQIKNTFWCRTVQSCPYLALQSFRSRKISAIVLYRETTQKFSLGRLLWIRR